MAFGQFDSDSVVSRKPTVNAMYNELLASGMSEKDAAKTAQQRTGVSLVSGRTITKKVEFTPKVSYGGQYPGREHEPKRWKPAAWPK